MLYRFKVLGPITPIGGSVMMAGYVSCLDGSQHICSSASTATWLLPSENITTTVLVQLDKDTSTHLNIVNNKSVERGHVAIRVTRVAVCWCT